MATLQNIGILKYRDKDGNWHPLPVVLQSSGGGQSVQADWAQNDPTATDFVKNRPGGYYGDLVTVDEEIYSGTIEPDQSEVLVDWLLVAGQTYKVTIGEVTKSYTAFADVYDGISGVTIGDGIIEDAAESGEVFALFTAEIEAGKVALLAYPEEDEGKTIRVTQSGTAREVHKIPAELLDIPPAEQVPQVVTVRLVERDGKQYGSMTFDEVLAAQRGGKEVRLLDNEGHYYQLTGIYNADERICFHSLRLRTLWVAIMETGGYVNIYSYNLGQQELTYDAGGSYLSLTGSASEKLDIYSETTRQRYLINIKLQTQTTGAYVQLQYYKQTKTINLCKHEDLGDDGVVLDMELNRVSTNATSYLVTMHLLNPDGTAHASGYYYCGELDLRDSDKSNRSAEIWITSGTSDKLADKLTYKEYTR